MPDVTSTLVVFSACLVAGLAVAAIAVTVRRFLDDDYTDLQP